MIEYEASEIFDCFPFFWNDPAETKYFWFLRKAFEKNYQDGLYQFSFFAYYMLMMTWLYCNLQKIKKCSCSHCFKKNIQEFHLMRNGKGKGAWSICMSL